MTTEEFRALALDLEGTVEGEHMAHPDFRVGGKIFATLWPAEARGMVKLTPDQQEMLCSAEPAIFAPVPGGWGRRGATSVFLAAADREAVASALAMALENVASKRRARRPPAARGKSRPA